VGRLAMAGLVLALIACVAPPVFAQTCQGLPEFNGQPFQVGGGMQLSSQVTATEFGLTVGGPYVFGGVHAGPYWYSGGARSTVFGFGGGIEIPIAPDRRVEICPNGSINSERGPDVPGHPEVDVKSSVALGGVSLGARIGPDNGVQLVPSVNVSVVRAVPTVTTPTASVSATQTYGVTDLGLGLIVTRHVTLRAGVAIPIQVDNSETRFSFGVAFSF
jgi:hypothetical protein